MKRSLIHPGSIVFLILLFCMNICRNFLWLIPSVLMSPMMEELSLNYTQAGQLLLIVTAFMGVFLLFGSYLQGRLSPMTMLILGMAGLMLDGVCSFLGKNFPVVLVGKVFCGMGYGLTTCSSMALIAAWFPQEQIGIANGINGCVSALSTSLAYALIAPIYTALGTNWRMEALLWSGCAVLVAALFYGWYQICGKNSLQGRSARTKAPNQIKEAFRFPVIRRFVLMNSCIMLVYVCFNSYYPNYLHEVVGFSLDEAGRIVSAMSIAGMAGSLVMGSTLQLFRHRKPVLLCLLTGFLLGFCGMLTLRAAIPLVVSVCLFGACFSAITVFCNTTIMSQKGISPLTAGAGVSLMSGFGSLFGIIVPTIQQTLAIQFGLRGALLLFGVLLIPYFLLAVTLPKAILQREDITNRILNNFEGQEV